MIDLEKRKRRWGFQWNIPILLKQVKGMIFYKSFSVTL